LTAAKFVVYKEPAGELTRIVLARTTVEKQIVERRRPDRRRRDALFYLVERRNGELWKYGAIALSVVLWTIVVRLFLR
jgi:hypothetical protein